MLILDRFYRRVIQLPRHERPLDAILINPLVERVERHLRDRGEFLRHLDALTRIERLRRDIDIRGRHVRRQDQAATIEDEATARQQRLLSETKRPPFGLQLLAADDLKRDETPADRTREE